MTRTTGSTVTAFVAERGIRRPTPWRKTCRRSIMSSHEAASVKRPARRKERARHETDKRRARKLQRNAVLNTLEKYELIKRTRGGRHVLPSKKKSLGHLSSWFFGTLIGQVTVPASPSDQVGCYGNRLMIVFMPIHPADARSCPARLRQAAFGAGTPCSPLMPREHRDRFYAITGRILEPVFNGFSIYA